MKSKLIGKIVTITDKGSWMYDQWGMIVHYNGEYYHFAPYCETLETAKNESTMAFKRNEFKIKRK